MMIKHWLSPFFAGATFATGLMVSGMTRPGKVIAFLDFGGQWDPSLAFVMLGALLVYGPLQNWVRKRPEPFWEQFFQVPSRRDLDASLATGAVLFGVGWGLAGYCPGPALTSVVTGGSALVFVLAMTAGMWLHSVVTRRPGTEPKAERKAKEPELSRPARADG